MLLLEIGMLVFGIVTLVKGRITLSGAKVVTGAPAYVIGGLLTATLPMALVIGVGLGFFVGMQAAAQHRPMPPLEGAIWVDIGVVLLMGLICVVIAMGSAKLPEEEGLGDFPMDMLPPDDETPFSDPPRR
jgi:hypothetical protein